MNGDTIAFHNRNYLFSIYDDNRNDDPVVCSAVWIGKTRKL